MSNRAKYLPDLAIASANAGFPAAYFPAICYVESGFNAKQRSPKGATDDKYGGAWGLAQFTYDTAQGLGYKGAPEGLWDVQTTIGLLTRYTAQNVKNFGLAPTDMRNLAACHNAGVPFSHIHDPKRMGMVTVYANHVLTAAQILERECDDAAVAYKRSRS